MAWNVIIRRSFALALVFGGAQFTHSDEIDGGFGHAGHHDHAPISAPVGPGEVETAPGNEAGEPAGGGAHCGAPLMAVNCQNSAHVRTALRIPAVPLDSALLTVRHELDPPPPRA